MQIRKVFGLTLLGCFLWSSSSNAAEPCPSGTIGLCDPSVLETVVETITETTQNDGTGTLTTTVTVVDTTTVTVTNADSGDILDGDNGFVASTKEGDMDSDWGGEGPASMPSGTGCGALGTDKCASITGSGNTTSTMGVPNMGTTFKQTIDISDLNISKGGKTTYSIKVDKQDSSDSIYMHITGTNGSAVSFAGTDVLSASGVSSGYAEYTGAFDFADSLTTIIVEIGGRDINLAIGPLFDDVSINVLYNVISTIVLQTITTVEQYVYNNDGATETEIDIVKDIFDHNDIVEPPDGDMYFEPIEPNEDISYDTVETELDLPNFEMDFEIELPDFEMEFNTGDFEMPNIDLKDLEMEMELDIDTQPPPAPTQPEPDIPPVMNNDMDLKPGGDMADAPEAAEEKIEVASAEPETKPEIEAKPEPETKPVDETKDEPEPDVKEEVKQEPTEEIKEEPVKVQKKIAKQKAGSKLVKEMGNASRYDSGNQLKTLIIMNVIADTKSFFVSKQFKEIEGFFTSEVLPDSNIPDNNVAAYLMYVDDGGTMSDLIDLQYK
jgi:hypothetical protein